MALIFRSITEGDHNPFSDRVTLIFLLHFFGILWIVLFYRSYHSGAWLYDVFVFFVLAIVFFPLLLSLILKDIRDYIYRKKFQSFIPSFSGVFVILILTGIYFYYERKHATPNLMSAFYDGAYNGCSIDLKIDGTYIVMNGSFLGADYFYGTYNLHDSLIILDQTLTEAGFSTNTFFISKSTDLNNMSYPLLRDQYEIRELKPVDINSRTLRVKEDNR